MPCNRRSATLPGSPAVADRASAAAGLALRWAVSVGLRMAPTQARLVDLLAGGLDAQLASLVTREAEQGAVHLAQSMLADLLGARRTSVYRVLKRFEARDL